MTKIIRILIALAISLLAIAAIFFFSDQKGTDSHQESGRFAAKMAEMITSAPNARFTDAEKKTLEKGLDYPIRKCAHLFIYFCLGFILYLSMVFVQEGKKKPIFILICMLIIIVIAFADEINQLSSEGRGASGTDVLIDTVGGTAGIYFYYIVTDFIGHVRNLLKKNDVKEKTSEEHV